MNASLKKLWNDYGIVSVIALIVCLYVLNILYKYFISKGSAGPESLNSLNYSQYSNGQSVVPPGGVISTEIQAADEKTNELYSNVNETQQLSSQTQPIQSSNELLPTDTNSQWAQLNPSGTGELASINLLKAGYHVGIDTVGQTLKNANLQIRSEPPNPQLSVGPWNNSTITPDLMRTPLELGGSSQ